MSDSNEPDGGGDGGENRDSGQDGGGSGGEGQDGGQGPSTAEKTLTALSIVVTLLLFGYVAWQAVQPSAGDQPRVEVLETQDAPNGSVLVSVALTNPGDSGLISATVEANCSKPPPEATFSYVPAGDRERGVLVCPSGTTRANVSVTSWVPS